MLQSIRDRAQGWIAWAIIALISIPFALWGIQSYLDVGGEPTVAEVNGVKITERELDRRVQMARFELRERLGASFDASRFDDKRLRQEVLDDMIRETLLVDVSRRMGLGVSDRELRAQILAEPAFQRDGQFDKTAYERVLELQGMSPPMFEAQLRQRIVGTQMIRAVVGSELATELEREQLQRLSGQKREIAWMRVPATRYAADAPIPDERIRAYYEANARRFQIPEQVKLEYLVLDVASLASKGEVSEEDLKRAYESDLSRFGQPERRHVRHILLTVPPDSGESQIQAVREEIGAVRERILGGESFDAVAKAVSKDPGSKELGGDLGEIERGLMDPAFDEAAFALEAGTLSEPVRTRFGWHLVLVDSIVPSQIKPFEQVRDELKGELAKQRAESLFYDMGERLANVVYESSDSLEPAARELGLTVRQSDWIGREGGEGLLGHPKVTAAAFSEEVLNERRNSDLIEPEKDVLQAVALRVVDHREASVKPLDAVRDEILTSLREEAARSAASAAAVTAAERLRGGSDWSAALPQAAVTAPAPATPAPEVGAEPERGASTADNAKGTEPPAQTEADAVQRPGLVGRRDPKVPAPVREAAFGLPVPADGKPSVSTLSFENGDPGVVQVIRVVDGEVKVPEKGSPSPESEALIQSMGRQSYEAMLGDMERRADIERRPLPEIPEG